MDVHNNARATRHSRMLMVKRLTDGWTVAAVASAQGVTPKTVRKWRDRFAAESACGLADRTSRPPRSPRRLGKEQQEAIVALRRERLSGPVMARQLQRPVSTVGLALRRAGLGRLAALDPKPRSLATSAKSQANLSISTSRSLAVSTALVTASRVTAPDRAANGAPAGNICM
jgi:hypothetical protein